MIRIVECGDIIFSYQVLYVYFDGTVDIFDLGFYLIQVQNLESESRIVTPPFVPLVIFSLFSHFLFFVFFLVPFLSKIPKEIAINLS